MIEAMAKLDESKEKYCQNKRYLMEWQEYKDKQDLLTEEERRIILMLKKNN